MRKYSFSFLTEDDINEWKQLFTDCVTASYEYTLNNKTERYLLRLYMDDKLLDS